MNSNSDLSSLRSGKSAWFNLKYLLLFLNMILVYVNSGLFFYLFTKDFRKAQQFNLKDYPNLRYATQISSDRINQSLEDEYRKPVMKTVLHYSDSDDDEVNFYQNRLQPSNQKYKALNEVVSMFGQQMGVDNTANEEANGDANGKHATRPSKELKRVGLLEMIRNRPNDSPSDLNSEITASLNQQLNSLVDSSKKNKTLIKKATAYNDLLYSLNKQLSLIYLLLGLNNFLNFICLTKESKSSILLVLTLPPVFTVLPLIITKFNYEINLWLFVVYIVIGFLTLIHVKRLKKQSTSEHIIVHSPSRLYPNNFVALDGSSTTTTVAGHATSSQFLMSHHADLDSCKSSLSGKEKSNCNLISVTDKKGGHVATTTNDQVPIRRMMNFFKKITPPPSYSDSMQEGYYSNSKPDEI